MGMKIEIEVSWNKLNEIFPKIQRWVVADFREKLLDSKARLKNLEHNYFCN